ncbi:MAG: bifunctional nuclease family protein [Bacteroidetes bacterium]|nr:bifunctional nuclease family protein [Bacteroidota bacterium]MDA0903531.1 bifunctional nuclease family protein [Bacteroidota bacterium]MDA1241884.1 bifunctional nuclease family protein [Bacteroidota bacterium]
MKKVDLEILDIALSGSSSGAYALVMGEVNGRRKLPIVIGGAEAQSIAIELENMKPSRPLTHDLMKNALTAFGMEVTEVLIHKMVEGVFYAQITVTDGVREEYIDSRSSDAVAVGVRFGCPLRCSEEVLQIAGIDPEGEGEDAVDRLEELEQEAGEQVTVEELKKKLQEAIEHENYELASELKKRIDQQSAG